MIGELAQLEQSHLVFLTIGFSLILLCPAIVVCVIAVQVRKSRTARMELAFKRELLDRGLSADEAERVVRARRPGLFLLGIETLRSFVASLGDTFRKLLVRCLIAAQWSLVRRHRRELGFKRELVNRGLSANEIERIVHARSEGLLSRLFEWLQAMFAKVMDACRQRWDRARENAHGLLP